MKMKLHCTHCKIAIFRPENVIWLPVVKMFPESLICSSCDGALYWVCCMHSFSSPNNSAVCSLFTWLQLEPSIGILKLLKPGQEKEEKGTGNGCRYDGTLTCCGLIVSLVHFPPCFTLTCVVSHFSLSPQCHKTAVPWQILTPDLQYYQNFTNKNIAVTRESKG